MLIYYSGNPGPEEELQGVPLDIMMTKENLRTGNKAQLKRFLALCSIRRRERIRRLKKRKKQS